MTLNVDRWLAHFRRNIQIFRKRAHGALVHFEEQCVLAAEVLENRTLRNSESEGDIGYARIFITVLSEMPSRSLDDAPALGLRTRMHFVQIPGGERKKRIGCGRGHGRDLKSRQHSERVYGLQPLMLSKRKGAVRCLRPRR